MDTEYDNGEIGMLKNKIERLRAHVAYLEEKRQALEAWREYVYTYDPQIADAADQNVFRKKVE